MTTPIKTVLLSEFVCADARMLAMPKPYYRSPSTGAPGKYMEPAAVVAILQARPSAYRWIDVSGAGKADSGKFSTVEQFKFGLKQLGDALYAANLHDVQVYSNLEQGEPIAQRLIADAFSDAPWNPPVKTFLMTGKWKTMDWFGEITRRPELVKGKFVWCPGFCCVNQRMKDDEAVTGVSRWTHASAETLATCASILADGKVPVPMIRHLTWGEWNGNADLAPEAEYKKCLAQLHRLICQAGLTPTFHVFNEIGQSGDTQTDKVKHNTADTALCEFIAKLDSRVRP